MQTGFSFSLYELQSSFMKQLYVYKPLTGLLGQRQQVGNNECHARFIKFSLKRFLSGVIVARS